MASSNGLPRVSPQALAAATGNVLTVGPGQQYATIQAAVAAASAGDTIDVQAGVYTNDFISIFKDLTLQAVGGIVRLVATVSSAERQGDHRRGWRRYRGHDQRFRRQRCRRGRQKRRRCSL